MNKLERLQKYAMKCADKLGVTGNVILRWSGDTCRVKGNTYAHCHVKDGEYKRGTICLNRFQFATDTVKMQHHTIAHEVTHLAVKSGHRTPTFDRRLVTLGVANCRERRNARSTRNHRHEWGSGRDESGYFRYCRVCYKKEMAS